jgi:hypothetical protein
MGKLEILETFTQDFFREQKGYDFDKNDCFENVYFINYIPLDELFEQVKTKYKEYKNNYPYSVNGDFSEYFIQPLLENIEFAEDLLFRIDHEDFLYSLNDTNIAGCPIREGYFSNIILLFFKKAEDNVHFYQTYLKSVFAKFENFEQKYFPTIDHSPILKKETNFKTVKFHGDKTKFIELIKALIENGNLKKTDEQNQESIIAACAMFFEMDIPNPSKLISDLSKRNNDSQTLFLNELQKSLLNYIKERAEKSSR